MGIMGINPLRVILVWLNIVEVQNGPTHSIYYICIFFGGVDWIAISAGKMVWFW